jgi:hypothetical protein
MTRWQAWSLAETAKRGNTPVPPATIRGGTGR